MSPASWGCSITERHAAASSCAAALVVVLDAASLAAIMQASSSATRRLSLGACSSEGGSTAVEAVEVLLADGGSGAGSGESSDSGDETVRVRGAGDHSLEGREEEPAFKNGPILDLSRNVVAFERTRLTLEKK